MRPFLGAVIRLAFVAAFAGLVISGGDYQLLSDSCWPDIVIGVAQWDGKFFLPMEKIS